MIGARGCTRAVTPIEQAQAPPCKNPFTAIFADARQVQSGIILQSPPLRAEDITLLSVLALLDRALKKVFQIVAVLIRFHVRIDVISHDAASVGARHGIEVVLRVRLLRKGAQRKRQEHKAKKSVHVRLRFVHCPTLSPAPTPRPSPLADRANSRSVTPRLQAINTFAIQ